MPFGPIDREITDRLGIGAVRVERLHGGCVAEVYKVALKDESTIVVKVDRCARPRLDLEAWMLTYLAEYSALPVPKIICGTPELLALEFLPGDNRVSKKAEAHAAGLLAALHNVRANRFGLERGTLIGPLHQPNRQSDSWIAFFREYRLQHFARAANKEGCIGSDFLRRIETIAERLDDWLEEPEHPSLLHGDIWSGNVLADNDRITGLLDPAVYYGHPEIELAFITLFNTFGDPFFERYQELRPIRPGFFEVRRDIYNLYPLLVHVRLFGGDYVSGVDATLRRFGC